MKTIYLNWKTWIIGILAATCIICWVSEPISNNTWFRDFFISKAIGTVAGYFAYRLAVYWGKKEMVSNLNKNGEV